MDALNVPYLHFKFSLTDVFLFKCIYLATKCLLQNAPIILDPLFRPLILVFIRVSKLINPSVCTTGYRTKYLFAQNNCTGFGHSHKMRWQYIHLN